MYIYICVYVYIYIYDGVWLKLESVLLLVSRLGQSHAKEHEQSCGTIEFSALKLTQELIS